MVMQIRPIDRKLQYQIQKLTSTAMGTVKKSGPDETKAGEIWETEDVLKLRPNPDLLVSKTDTFKEDGGGVYRPPKLAPSAMGEDKISKKERNDLRRDKEIVRQAKQSAYVRELMDDLEGRPEEIRENIGSDSKEVTNYIANMEERARREEELFTRAPVTKVEKKKMKHLKKSRNGLLGLSESFYDEIKTLPIKDDVTEQPTGFSSGGDRTFKKRKRKH
ncbi:hypothetical protein OROGR_025434 [Orobanche gracilis]